MVRARADWGEHMSKEEVELHMQLFCTVNLIWPSFWEGVGFLSVKIVLASDTL